MPSKTWYASDDFQNDQSPLITPTTHGTSNPKFLDAQKMSIDVVAVWPRRDRDGWGKGNNDLVVATRHRVGDKPIVDKVHFLQKGVPERDWQGNFFHPVVMATEDFREKWGEITLQVRVYDEDGLDKESAKALQSAITSSASAAAVAFPAFAPIAGFSGGAGSALVNLVNNLDDHDEIVDARIRLAVNKPNQRAWNHLQPGFLVFFSDEIEADELVLKNDLRIYYQENEQLKPYEQHSYVILRVQRGFIPTPDLIIDEKAATLLSEIENGKGRGSTEALKFLRETLTSYNNFKKLDRIRELQAKEIRTSEEEELLESLRNDATLSPYLPAVV